MKYAKDGLEFIIEQNSPLILRILVLPGHVDCCHKLTIELLSQYKDSLYVSILDQYVPEHEAHLDQNLKNRPTEEKLYKIKSMIKKNCLKDVTLD
jgi:putative pyruvate formate lyase activating enzyme